jgi:hypothetical protein
MDLQRLVQGRLDAARGEGATAHLLISNSAAAVSARL